MNSTFFSVITQWLFDYAVILHTAMCFGKLSLRILLIFQWLYWKLCFCTWSLYEHYFLLRHCPMERGTQNLRFSFQNYYTQFFFLTFQVIVWQNKRIFLFVLGAFVGGASFAPWFTWFLKVDSG